MGEPLVIVVPQSFRDDLERVREARMNIVDEIAEKLMKTHVENIECLVYNYLKETGYKASEVELVEERSGQSVHFYCRRRTNEPIHNNNVD